MSYPYYTVTPIAAGRNSTIEVFPVGRRAVIGVDIPFSLLCYPLGSGDEEFQARCDTIQHYYDEKARVRRRYDYPDGRQRYSRDCRDTLHVQSSRHEGRYQRMQMLRRAEARDAKRERIELSLFTGTIDSSMLRYYAGDPDVEYLGAYVDFEECANDLSESSNTEERPDYSHEEHTPIRRCAEYTDCFACSLYGSSECPAEADDDAYDDYDDYDFDAGSPGDNFTYREYTDYHVKDTIDVMCEIYTELLEKHFGIVPHKLLSRWFKAFNTKRDFDFEKCLQCPHNTLYSTDFHRHLPEPCIHCCLNSPSAFGAIQKSQFDVITLFGGYGPKELRSFLGWLFFDPYYNSK